MKPFQPKPDRVLKNTYEVPPDMIEDTDILVGWPRRAFMAQTEMPPIARPKRKRKLKPKNK